MPQAPVYNPSSGEQADTGPAPLQASGIFYGYAQQKTAAQLFAEETATLLVGGMKFSNWESVQVKHRWTEPYPLFQFTTADVIEAPQDWQLLRFLPGEECAIYLG